MHKLRKKFKREFKRTSVIFLNYLLQYDTMNYFPKNIKVNESDLPFQKLHFAVFAI